MTHDEVKALVFPEEARRKAYTPRIILKNYMQNKNRCKQARLKYLKVKSKKIAHKIDEVDS